MRKEQAGILALLLVIAIAVGSIWLRRSNSRSIDLDPYAAMGIVAGEETSALLGNQGDVVVVVEDPGEDDDPVLKTQLARLKSGLSTAGKVRIKAVEKVVMDPMTRLATGGTLPPARFASLRGKYPDAAAMVLLMPFPMLGDSDLAALKAGRQRYVVASAAVPGYRKLVASGAVSLAIVPRPKDGSEPSSAKPKTTRERFDRDYVIAKPETADRLPY